MLRRAKISKSHTTRNTNKHQHQLTPTVLACIPYSSATPPIAPTRPIRPIDRASPPPWPFEGAPPTMSLVNLAHVCSHMQNASKARLGLTSIPVSKLHVNLMLGLQ